MVTMRKQLMLTYIAALVGLSRAFPNPFGGTDLFGRTDLIEVRFGVETGGGFMDIALPAVIEAHVVRTSGQCRSDWVQEADRCYFISYTERTYDDAQAYCASHGGNLVGVPSGKSCRAEFKNLQIMAMEIGLEGFHWIGVRQDWYSKIWQTLQTQNIGKSIWAEGEPKQPGDNETQCAALGLRKDRYEVSNFDCTTEHKFICVETCRDGWFYNSEKKQCMFLSEDKKTWKEAKEICENEFYGEFPLFQQIEEVAFPQKIHVKEGLSLADVKYWVGGYQKKPKTDLFYGMNRNLFKTGEPTGSKAKNPQCVNMCSSDPDNKFKTFCDDNCDEPMNFICTKPADY